MSVVCAEDGFDGPASPVASSAKLSAALVARLFRVERVHYGHMGDCTVFVESIGLPCSYWMVGVGLRSGGCDWFSAADLSTVIADAEAAVARADRGDISHRCHGCKSTSFDGPVCGPCRASPAIMRIYGKALARGRQASEAQR